MKDHGLIWVGGPMHSARFKFADIFRGTLATDTLAKPGPNPAVPCRRMIDDNFSTASVGVQT